MATLPASAISVFHFDSDLNDALGNATVLNSGATLSAAQSKFGAKSAYFNGTATTGSYASIALPDTPVYTVAMWIYRISSPTTNWTPTPVTAIYSDNALGAYIQAVFKTNNYPLYGVEWNQQIPGGNVLPANAWHHIAITKSGNTHMFYVNGTLIITITYGSTAALKKLYLGVMGYWDGSYDNKTFFQGYIDEVLITNDVLWTENFTPPTDAYVTPTFAITASAGANGSISPSGTVNVSSGANQTFTITPNTGYEIDTLTVDGSPVTKASSYTFTNVTAAHTISVTFKSSYDVKKFFHEQLNQQLFGGI